MDTLLATVLTWPIGVVEEAGFVMQMNAAVLFSIDLYENRLPVSPCNHDISSTSL